MSMNVSLIVRVAVARAVGMNMLMQMTMTGFFEVEMPMVMLAVAMIVAVPCTVSVDVLVNVVMNVALVVRDGAHAARRKIDDRGLGTAVASACRAHQAASSSCIDFMFSSSPLRRSTFRLPHGHGV